MAFILSLKQHMTSTTGETGKHLANKVRIVLVVDSPLNRTGSHRTLKQPIRCSQRAVHKNRGGGGGRAVSSASVYHLDGPITSSPQGPAHRGHSLCRHQAHTPNDLTLSQPDLIGSLRGRGWGLCSQWRKLALPVFPALLSVVVEVMDQSAFLCLSSF